MRHGRTNMDVPVSIGVVLVTALSLLQTIRGGAHAYFDSAVMLLAGFAMSYLQNRYREKITMKEAAVLALEAAQAEASAEAQQK